jgi:hypothetical protein
MFSGVALLVLGVVLLGSSVVLVVDFHGAGTKFGRIGAVWGSLFGNRYALGRERALGRFYGLILLVIGCGAVAAAIPRR